MSSNGDNGTYAAEPSSSDALGVGFASVADGRQAESSSQAESRSSGKRSLRSLGSREQQHAEPVTPEERRKKFEGEGHSNGSLGQKARRSGGFLLESVFANGSPKGGQDVHGKRKAQDGQLRVDKRRQPAQSVRSGESSLRGSPLAREVSWDGGTEVDGQRERQTSRPQTMDPAQLVQMALNLSESRKRNVSSTLQVPLPSPNRVVSMPMTNYGTVRKTSTARKRSIRLSDNAARDSYSSNRISVETGSDDVPIVSSPGPDNVMYTFSPATLSRAEKARKYFELASEHRRLLQYLPPLKPDASAPGNFTFESKNQPGSAYPLIRRVTSSGDDKHELGREYNPIQALRNRRIRIREKRPFPAPPDSWADPDNVRTWIDEVESATEHPHYRADADAARVPRFEGDDEASRGGTQQGASGHRRTDTVGSVITRPENSWTIEPTELLADTYWTEKGNNKAYIENRHGNTIFPNIERRSIDTPRISVELHRGREDYQAAGVDTEDFGDIAKHSRRLKLLMPLKNRTSERPRRHTKVMSRSSSVSSGSTTDGRLRSREGFENIGPLERHMQELIAKDEHGELSSPDVVSPDHWEANKPMPFPRMSTDESYQETAGRSSGRDSLDVPRDLHRRTKSADGRVNSTSQDVAMTDRPSTAQKATSSVSLDKSAGTEERRSFDATRPTGSRPGSFRSLSKDRNMVEQHDFAAAASPTNLSPIMSGDPWRPRASHETERPMEFKRHKTGESLSSLDRQQTSATTSTFSSVKEPGSSVGRFLKGGRDRIGTLVRGERFRNKDKLDTGSGLDQYRAASDMSDVDDGEGANGYTSKWRMADSPGESTDVSPRASLDKNRASQKYQLPSFTSSARGRRGVVPGTPITAETNPFERFKGAQNDAGKGQRPIPPRINIPEEDDAHGTAAPNTTIRFDTTPRKSYGDLALDAPPSSSRTISRSPGQRHWSIYDQVQPLQPANRKITARDIAGVRALLLCSGIKAREIQRLANRPRGQPHPELVKAAATAGQTMEPVPLKDEALVASRMLSNHLSTTFSTFETALANFQNVTAPAFTRRLDELQQKASDQLTKHVHEASDEADAFIVELTTKQPQQTKRVDEAVDTMVRRRRRQFRLLRQAGFKVLEWLVLGIMWWIWFIVVVFNMARKGVVGVGRLGRWLVVP